jgi:hypothetical protein
MRAAEMKFVVAFAFAVFVSVCAAGEERVFLKCENPLRFEFSNARYRDFALPGLKEAFAAIPPEERPRDFYIKCRAVRLDGSVSWKVRAAGDVSWKLPISGTGKIETLFIRPEIVSMRKTSGYDYRRLKDVRLVGSGSGEIEIFELGTADVGTKPKPHDAGLPKVGIDDFAIFPEPRILRKDGRVVSLRSFGGTYRLEGDVPPAPVARFVRDMEDFYGVVLKESKDARIVISVADRTDIPDYGRIVHDGFAIVVTEREIRVAAKDPKGLVYGIGVLSDSVKMASGDVGEAHVPLMTVVDWPRMKVRLFDDMARCAIRYQKYDADFYADIFERFVLASRFNMLAVEPGAMYRWDSAPYGPVKQSAWDRAEFEHLVDRINANAVSVVPKMNGLGHVDTSPLGNEESNRRYGEDGNKMVLCTANPETDKMLFGTFGEILSICSRNPKFAPRYFHAGMDEVRWQTDELPPEKRCRRCAGRAKNSIFLEQVERIRAWCRARGLRMVMWADMIRAYHNGLNKFRCSDIEPQIPKDVIYDNWSSHDNFEIAASSAAGRENWKCLTGYKDDPLGDEFVSGYGIYICTYNWWLSSATVKGEFGNGAYGLMAQRILSDQMWRRKPSRHAGDGGSRQAHKGDGASLLDRWGDFLLRNWSRKPIPHGSAAFKTVDLSGLAKLKVDAAMDVAVKSVGGIPVAVPVKDGLPMAVAATEKGVVLPVGRRAASICFLHGAPVAPENRELFSGFGTACRINLKGAKIAEYEVVYEDGDSECVEIGYGWNVPEWNSLDRLFARFARYPVDSRGIWEGKLPEPGANGEAQTAVASIYEWVNPHPHKAIVSLKLTKSFRPVDYSLFALTLRECKADFGEIR